MSRVIHLSDLHFGRDRPDILGPLQDSVNGLNADLMVISGDLTQRARHHQFEDAKQFIGKITAPVLTVPGNHDIPLHRPITRFLAPFLRYKQWINADLTPQFETDDMVVIGINSVDRFAWQAGRLSARRLRHACTAMERAPKHKARIIVMHHPLEHPVQTKKKPARGAKQALDQLLSGGADMILSGHLHAWHAENFKVTSGTHSAVQLHAGTTLSTRLRGEPNDFNVIDISPASFDIQRLSFVEENQRFETTEARHFSRASLNS
ncbi:metallophosphoesterase [Sulfitobacter sp. AS59]|uniref:metallophosphoesterase family protein n=1 Tax=Sulfitobacter sp. AS59 TaxID=3135784 RepID=UPI00316DE494